MNPAAIEYWYGMLRSNAQQAVAVLRNSLFIFIYVTGF